MAGAPQIETDRLMLRGHRLDDLGAAFAMWSDPAVTRFIGGKPSTEQQTWSNGSWDTSATGRCWGSATGRSRKRRAGRFVSELGFADFRRDIHASMKHAPELGWALASDAHGKGYATEAVRAAVAWGDVRFASARTVCMINEDNLASIRVAQKCGYREFERTLFNDRPTIFFERP